MKNENFLDARTLMAVGLVAVTFIGWQTYMQKKYPEQLAKPAEAVATVSESGVGTAQQVESKPQLGQPAGAPHAKAVAPVAPEKLLSVETAAVSFELSSKGMSIKNLKLKHFKDRKHQTVQLGHAPGDFDLLETRGLGTNEKLNFIIESVSPKVFVGRANIGGVEVRKTLALGEQDYHFEFKIATSGSDDRFLGLSTALVEDVDPVVSAMPLMPQLQKQEFYVESSDSKDRFHFDGKDAQKAWTKVRVASVGSQYFTEALVDKSDVIPDAKGTVNPVTKSAELILQYPLLNKGQSLNLQYDAFIGPKLHSTLSTVDDGLARVVDFGFFNWIGKHILGLLRFFHELSGNWGWAIILLTLLVRVLVLPFNIYSYKSMRAMQAIQPKIQALREKYKDDQQKQQQEILGLMRSNKVNPLGGCLPVLLQFPIFIALYQVLGNSIELYQAPFALWIHDLSLKDPYYILPVLMGGTMFIQQKVTPNTMDPAQAKVLMFMPLIFTFFMVTLPSGLTLYMWVGSVFSVLQQLYFLKQSNTSSGGVK